MGLVIFVPFVTSVHAIEIPRLPWAVLVLPCVRCRVYDVFFKVEKLLFLVHVLFRLGSVKGLRVEIRATGCLSVLNNLRLLSGFGHKTRSCYSPSQGKLRNVSL